MSVAVSRSTGGTFIQSTGGVRGRVAITPKYYYVDEFYTVTVPLSGFYNWSHLPYESTNTGYTDTVNLNLPLYDKVTDEFIGDITTSTTYAPRLGLYTTLGCPGGYDYPAPACPASNESDYVLAGTNNLYTAHGVNLETIAGVLNRIRYHWSALYYLNVLAGTGLATGTPIVDSDSIFGEHSIISGYVMVKHPVLGDLRLVLVGEEFYKLQVQINVDVDVSEFMSDKFDDSEVGTSPVVYLLRSGRNILDWEAYYDFYSSPIGKWIRRTSKYDEATGCVLQNTQVSF